MLKFETTKQVNTRLLREIPVLSSLEDDELEAMVAAEDNGIEQYEPKELIIREAEIGDCMYVILEGSVEVLIRSGTGGRELSIATLRGGDFFGEQSLLPENTNRRNASIRALTPSTVFRIDKRYVLLAITGVDHTEHMTTIKPRTEEEEVKELITSMRLFKALKEIEVDMMHTWTEVIKLGPGDLVLKEAEAADCLYVVLEGTVEIFTMDEDGKIVMLSERSKGGYFGELALLPGSSGERTAYARSNDIVKLIKVPKSYFRLLLNRDSGLAAAINKIADAQKEEVENIKKS